MTATTLQRTEDHRLVGVGALVITAAALAVANFGTSGENGGPVEYAGALGVCAVLALVLFGRVLPRTDRPGRAATICAVIAVLTLPAFWSGLPIVLGAAAAYAGMRASSAVPTAVGALAVVLGVVACVLG